MGTVIYTRGAQAVEVDEADTDQLARMGRDGWSPPAVDDDPAAGGHDDGLDAFTRAELDVQAADLGIDDADQLPNKAAVIDAIRAASASRGDDPAAGGTEGTDA